MPNPAPPALPFSFDPPAVESWEDPIFEQAGLSVEVVRADRIHPWVQGNKAWKLRAFMKKAEINPDLPFLSMGGAFSNHLAALGWLSHFLGRQSLFLIRGEKTEWERNPLMAQLRQWGQVCIPVTRSVYRELHQGGWSPFSLAGVDESRCIWVPMGADSPETLPHLADWARQLVHQSSSTTTLVVPMGTGGTFRGLANAWPETGLVWGIPVIKTGPEFGMEQRKGLGQKVRIAEGYSFGGYGKTNPALEAFRAELFREKGFPTEPCYSAKAFFAVKDLAKKGLFEEGSRILVLHTGGIFPWNSDRKSNADPGN